MLYAALLLCGAAKPKVTLLTTLPLVWGEGDVADVLDGRARRSALLLAIETQYDVRPIDVVTDAAIGGTILLIAQPRRLAPQELVAIDGFVRRGGRALIFADPELRWHSRYPLGDSRRPPPVTLLDPLFGHWGLVLGDSNGAVRMLAIGPVPVRTEGAGRWTVPKSCALVDPEIADCAIGKGRVILVADADVLAERDDVGPASAAIRFLLDSLSPPPSVPPNRTVIGTLIVILGLAIVILVARKRKMTGT